MNRIVVVGASAAGLAAAETLRREGFAGTVTLIGEEVDAPYDRPPLSKQILASQWESSRLFLRTAEQLSGLELDLRLGWHPTAHLELGITGQNLLHDHHPEFGPSTTRREIERGVYADFVWRF